MIEVESIQIATSASPFLRGTEFKLVIFNVNDPEADLALSDKIFPESGEMPERRRAVAIENSQRVLPTPLTTHASIIAKMRTKGNSVDTLLTRRLKSGMSDPAEGQVQK